MQPDSFSQNAAFNVSSFADKFIGTVCMRDRFDILMNYRAFIQVSCDVVRRGADHFHTTSVRLMIGFCAFEAGQKAVVDVDAPPSEVGRLLI